MKGAGVFLLVIGHVLARPELGIERKYEPSQDVQIQQLGLESDTASLPYLSHNAEPRRDHFEGAMIPVKLIYEPTASREETEAIVKQVSLESLANVKRSDGLRKKILNRVTRSREFPDLAISNHIPEYKTTAGNPTPEMYNDNFGGEHDSQEQRISDDIIGSQLLSFDADSYNRALGIEARTTNEKHAFGAPGLLHSPHPDTYTIIQNPETIGENHKNIVRRIDHYQTVFTPTMRSYSPLQLGTGSHSNIDARVLWPRLPVYHRSDVRGDILQARILDDHVPEVNYPYDKILSAYTTIVEYDPKSDQCTRNIRRQKRDTSMFPREQNKKMHEPHAKLSANAKDEVGDPTGYQEFIVEDLSRSGEAGPKIFKLKVRKGGVAIAGPGGIATAGSGGTAIVGPGGTAFTTQDGTAIVGPGGRLIEIPSNFQTTKIEARTNGPQVFIPSGGKILAHGPFVYYGKHMQNQMTMAPIIERL